MFKICRHIKTNALRHQSRALTRDQNPSAQPAAVPQAETRNLTPRDKVAKIDKETVKPVNPIRFNLLEAI